MREITYRQALNEALDEEMQRDEKVFIFGEDVAIYGGAYGVTAGLWKKYGDERVLDTPISENAIVGTALGAALTGMRPVAEIMYIDFIGLGLDQLNNQVAKIRYMFGGKCKVPFTLRTEGGAGRTLGAHHSQSLESWLIHIPGIKVVMPSTPYDAKGLLKSAIREDNPIVFIEHKMLYNTKGPVPEEEYTLPIGVADVKKEGKDATILTYSRMTLFSLKAAEELEKEGISVEVVDLRTLLPMDVTGAEIGMKVVENAFDYLDAPIIRVAGADVPMPKSRVLEELAIPDVERIKEGVKEVLK